MDGSSLSSFLLPSFLPSPKDLDCWKCALGVFPAKLGFPNWLFFVFFTLSQLTLLALGVGLSCMARAWCTGGRCGSSGSGSSGNRGSGSGKLSRASSDTKLAADVEMVGLLGAKGDHAH